MMRRLRSLRRDRRGATLVEATIVFPLVLVLTFGLVEFGYALWQYHAVEKATAAGARFLAARHGLRGADALSTELYTASVPDCFVSSSQPLGTPCSHVAGATGWSQACSGSGGGSCSAGVMSSLLTQMQTYAPFLTASNVTVQFQGTGMGFIGRGRPIPLVTVQTSGLTYNFVVMNNLLGLGPITMPPFSTTLPAEDQREGVPS